MPITVVLLVLASALAHAAWNAMLKKSSDPENAIVAMMGAGSVIAVTIALALGVPAPAPAATAWCLVAGLLEAGYFVTLARALARAPLGSVYTVVRGGALVIVWPVSVVALGEPVSMARIAGTALIVLGLAATSSRPDAAAKRATASVRSGLLVAAVCAVFVGGYNLAYKLALSSGGHAEAINAISLSTGSLLNVALLGARRRPLVLLAMRREVLRVVVGGALGSVGFLLFLAAMRDAGAGVVLTLRNASILFAQLFGVAMGERPGRLGLAGAALVVLGTVLLSS